MNGRIEERANFLQVAVSTGSLSSLHNQRRIQGGGGGGGQKEQLPPPFQHLVTLFCVAGPQTV